MLVLCLLFGVPLLLADGTAPVAPASSWLSPEGLNALLFALLALAPIVAALLRRFELGAVADKLDAAAADATALRGALVSTVAGVERFRKNTTPAMAVKLAEEIQAQAREDGTHTVQDAVVQIVTDPARVAGPPGRPVVPVPVDPVMTAVRTATGRIGPAALLLACLLLVGCVAPEAIEQARTEAALCHGHALDASLPLQARQIAADEQRAWLAQFRALDGHEVPGSEVWPALPPELAPVTAAAAGGGR